MNLVKTIFTFGSLINPLSLYTNHNESEDLTRKRNDLALQTGQEAIITVNKRKQFITN